MSRPVGPDAPETPLNVEELRLLAERERGAAKKREQRAQSARERATSALAPNADGYVTPRAPVHLGQLRKWLRNRHDDYAHRRIGLVELTECRRTAAAIGDLHKAESTVKGAEAATRAAAAQERMADVLSALEHGGAAVALLASLRASDGLLAGPRRPLPRAVTPIPQPAPSAEGSSA